MIKASAAIRMEPKWAEHLNDESKCQEWATHVKNTFNLTDDEVRYIFEELKYYALLKENGVNREEPAAIDKAWICDSASDSILAKELKLNARTLEEKAMTTSSAEGQVLVDPFLYPFLAKDSCLLSKPLESPEAALDSCLPRVKPGPTASWPQAITSYNEAQGDISGAFDKRPVANLLRLYGGSKESDSYACWLPTDFYVNDDGTVTIRSYINNLHPSHYVELYKTIAKVFAQFVPLLEQVTTDVTNPRGLRAVFDEKECYKLGEYTVKEFLSKGSRGELPKEYDEILADITIPHTMEYSEDSDTMDKIYLDEYELFSNWKSALEYIEPAPQVFFELRRSLAPRSFARFPLQASVEIFNFNLTPDNPKSFEGEWQAVGRAHERIFAVGLYFFSVENIANASLMLREPLQAISFYCERDVESFYLSHDVASDALIRR
ncbi:hypothetical protein H4218_001841 [Coemansia sp. IMI 209128]|nr:hypothetical protein H4218_001841 [Coemansia sp. IMI 209128]